MGASRTPDGLLTALEVAERLRVKPHTVLGWLQTGKLRGYLPGGTRMGWRVSEADLHEFLEQSANRPKSQERS